MIYCQVPSPLGAIYIAEEGEGGICWLNITQPENAKLGESELLAHAQGELARYFAGELTTFTTPLAPKGTAFQTDVWQALCNVPYGLFVSYGELAQRAGHPGASRAVGSAMAKNPIAIMQPCHRVLPANGALGNYSMGGPANKEWLLLLERQNSKL